MSLHFSIILNCSPRCALIHRRPRTFPAAYAANLSGDLATAYRLLHDFAKLEAGDIIVQNNAFSSVGMAVIQMANQMGVKTVNVISDDMADIDTNSAY